MTEEARKYLEQKGARWRVEDNVTNNFNPECVWAMELSLVEGISLLNEIRAIGLAFERNYQGKDKDRPLTEWYIAQQ